MHLGVKRWSSGFTLVELVMVLVVLAIVATVTTTFLSTGASMYAQATDRDRLLSQSRFAVERVTRELRNAVPNSVRVSADGRCIEFVPLISAGRYEAIPILPVTATSLNYHTAETNAEALSRITQQAKLVTVYPTAPSHLYDSSSFRTIALSAAPVTAAATSGSTVSVSFAAAGFEAASASQRLYLWQQPVSFCVEATGAASLSLFRYEGYNRRAIQPQASADFVGSALDKALMAEQLVAVTGNQFFTFSPGVLSRTSVVHLVLSFSSNFADQLFFNQEVHIPNVP